MNSVFLRTIAEYAGSFQFSFRIDHRFSSFWVSLEMSIQLGATYLSERLFRPLPIYFTFWPD